MVVLLNGRVFDWPRRKTNDALDAFCDAVTDARRLNNDARADDDAKVTPLESRPVREIDGGLADTLVILQREVGAIPGAGAGAAGTKESFAKAPTKICSIDATTCLIAAMTNPASGDTAVAHFDTGNHKQVESGIIQMLKLTKMSAAFQGKRPEPSKVEVLDDDDDDDGSKSNEVPKQRTRMPEKPSQDAQPTFSLPVVKLKLLGCVRFHEHSPDTLSSFLKVLISYTTVAFDLGDGFDVAVWNLNTVRGGEHLECRRRGFMIDVANGFETTCVECLEKNRSYPDARLRSLRFFHQDEELSSVSLFQGEVTQVRIKPAEKKTEEGEEKNENKMEKDAAAKEEEEAASIFDLFKVVVRPFSWKKWYKQDIASQPLSEFMKLSTTPHCEPPDFASQMKQTILYANLYNPTGVFGAAAGRPHIFAPDPNSNRWAQL